MPWTSQAHEIPGARLLGGAAAPAGRMLREDATVPGDGCPGADAPVVLSGPGDEKNG